MADEIIKRDDNRITVLAGVTDDASLDIKMLRVDPTTKRLLVSATVTAGSALTVGTTTITSGTTTRILYDNAGVLGEYTISGSGTVVAMATAPTFGTSITGSYLTASEILITDADKKIVSAPVATYPSLTEFSYVKGLSSAIQTQLNGKAATLSGTINEIAYFNSASTITSLAVATYPSLTELSYVKGVTSAIQTQIGNLVPKSLFNANTVIYATSDDTPAALTVGEQTVVGRATGGAISAIVIDSDLSSVSANDDTIPSAKATKAMGDLKLPLAGGNMTGNIILGENTSIALDPAGSADGKYTGTTVTGVSGYSQAFGDLVTLDKDDSRWEAVDISAAAAATGDARGILGMVVSAGTDGNACTILLNGIIRADANFPTLTIGAEVFASTTGDIVVTQPTTTDYVIRRVGSALTADEIYFNPSYLWYTHT